MNDECLKVLNEILTILQRFEADSRSARERARLEQKAEREKLSGLMAQISPKFKGII